jgi:hypothetical protein
MASEIRLSITSTPSANGYREREREKERDITCRRSFDEGPGRQKKSGSGR